MSDTKTGSRASTLAKLLHAEDAPRIDLATMLAQREAAGHDAGYAAACAESRQQRGEEALRWEAERQALIVAHNAALQAAQDDAIALHAALDAAFADLLATLVLDVARKVIGAEPSISVETLRGLLHDVAGALPDDAFGTIRLHPGTALVPPAGWVLREDAEVPEGELRAEVDARRITASLSLRLAALSEEIGA